MPMTAPQALSALPALLASDLPVVAFAETNWNETRHFLPILATPLLPIFGPTGRSRLAMMH